MSNNSTDWYKYEELASIIYSKLEPSARVKHDEKIHGHLTERLRQIDVTIRTEIGGHEILVIVEAKDRTRAPDVMVIDGFAQKMRDVSASRGVIVSRMPPSKQNISYASKLGIDICTAIDVKDHKWNEQILVPLLIESKEFIATPNLDVKQEGPIHFELPHEWLLSEDNGNSSMRIGKLILESLSESNIPEGIWNINFNNKSFKICLGGDAWHSIKISLDVKCNTRRLFRYCSPTEYKALRNFSNGKTRLADLKLEVPDLNDKNEWSNFEESMIASHESFLFADLVIYNMGLFSNEMGKPVIHEQKVIYLEKK